MKTYIVEVTNSVMNRHTTLTIDARSYSHAERLILRNMEITGALDKGFYIQAIYLQQ